MLREKNKQIILRKSYLSTDGLSKRLIAVLSSNMFLKLCFAWFLIQAVYFAFAIKFGLPPDETYHYNFIQLFSDNFPSPFLENQGNYTRLMESVRNPFFLYHYILSIPYLLIKQLSFSFIILRLINIGLAASSLYLIYKLSNLIKIPPFARNMTIFMICNTLMYTFLAASINYDNLFILLSLFSIYLLFKLMQSYTTKNFLLFLAVIIGGIMVKVNFIPIALAVVFIYALTQIIKGRHPSLHSFKTSFLKDKKVNIILLFVLFGLCIIFSQRIIYNVVSYGSYSPSCAQVRDINDCRKNSLFRRDEYVKGPGRQPATEPIPNYFVSWGKLMSERTFGIFTSSNRIIPTYRYFEFCLFAIVTLYLVASVRKINKNNPHIIILLAITAFYLAILLRENYNIYQDTGRIALAVQGRYAFVVLPFIYLVGNYYTEALFKKDIYKLGFAFLILITFFVSSLPNFLLNDSHIWYTKAVLSFVT